MVLTGGAVSLVTGFVAKEIVVSSMGCSMQLVMRNLKRVKDCGEGSSKFHSIISLCFMLFVLLYIPCLVALVTVIKELKNWKWSLFSVGYQLLFAWSAATLVFQGADYWV